ncbi:MAG TPA: amidase [Solibacterales bacterium]|nr:amidase [Bryobacterales bacterium]
MLAAAESLMGLKFTDPQRDMILTGLKAQAAGYDALRKANLSNSVPPALVFDPRPVGFAMPTLRRAPRWSAVPAPAVPQNLEDLAFASASELAALIKARKVTSEQLTRMYLARIKRYDPKLHAVITLTEDLALRQARQADQEIAAGKYRGPLHGLPYGLKDLFATKGIKTTWGSGAHKDQIIDEDATVVRKLRDAGAVLIAKTTLGELAMGDRWFGERTRNPWKLDQGSSGSSAGSASITAAGLAAFGIGTETLGSIVSPATRCGVAGLRPTFGRISRHGAMALSWANDKIGPLCRRVEDCAMVFHAIQGPDGKDQAVVEAPFNYNAAVDLKKLRVGYLKNDFDKAPRGKAQNDASLALLRKLGADLKPIELPAYDGAVLRLILEAESAAAFDDLTRSGRDALLVQQERSAWPNFFRTARYIPAVEYIQATRVRYQLIQDMHKLMSEVDVYVAPSFSGGNLGLTNNSGHPAVVVPNGFNQDGTPTSITFTGRLYDEALVLAVARQYQEAAGFYKQRPKLD